MKPLYNKFDRETLRQKLIEENEPRTTLSFYQYAKIGNPQLFRDYLYLKLDELRVLGRIYVAKEGINAQISVPTTNFEKLKDCLSEITFLEGVRLNVAVEQYNFSFLKLRIKVRNKIVADGLNDETFDVTKKGKHVNAAEFNQLIEQNDAIVVDLRNHYETEVGHFIGAYCPDVDTFREELKFVEEKLKGNENKKLIMYCTGGIRCEKASAYFKHKGFENVYQLNGGIIEYARQIKEQGLESKFIGKNFVFDERLGERITNDIIAVCHQCGNPNDDHTNCKNEGCHLLFIQCPNCKEKYEGCCSDECKEILHLPKEKQRELRKGKDKGQMIFKKGRSQKLPFIHQ